VRATGGLRETVTPFNVETLKGNGFVFREYSSEALVEAVKRALRCYKKSKIWRRVMQNGLKEEFAWEQVAKRYGKLYGRSL
jgi:starch synthase